MNDPVLKIAVCDRRTNSRYKNQERCWSWIKERNRRPIRTSETVAEYPLLPKERRDELKDQGGFVGGWLRGGVRKKGNVLFRCVGCLDADHVPGCAFRRGLVFVFRAQAYAFHILGAGAISRSRLYSVRSCEAIHGTAFLFLGLIM